MNNDKFNFGNLKIYQKAIKYIDLVCKITKYLTKTIVRGKCSELRTPNSELIVRDKGFTLIEIIVLIVMAGILLPAIIIPFATGVRGSVKPEMVTKAMYLAQQKMEEYMKYDYSGVPIVNQSSTPVDPINFPNYNWQWQIKLVQPDSGNGFQDSSTEGYKQIFVRVSDPEGTTYDVYSVVTDFP